MIEPAGLGLKNKRGTDLGPRTIDLITSLHKRRAYSILFNAYETHLHNLKIISVLVLVSSIVILSGFASVPLAAGVPTQNTQSSQSGSQPNTTFKSVNIDKSPIPHVPFKISVVLNSLSPSANLVATISVPTGVSVSSPMIVNLPNPGYGPDRIASWTLTAGSSGSYPISIVVYTDNPTETDTFNVNAAVGTPQSIVVTDVSIPGNLTPDQNFTVGIKLMNVADVADQNLLAQIAVPTGLLLMDKVSSSISSINPNQEVEFDWKIQAQAVGSYVLSINYSSANAGASSYKVNVNVGKTDFPSGALISIAAQSLFSPDSNDPVLFTIKNNGITPIHNLQIVSASGSGFTSADTPLWVGYLKIHETRTIPLHVYISNSTLGPHLPISVKYSTGNDEYSETYNVALQLADKPIFKINSVAVEPTLTFAGDTKDRIDLQISNLGRAATNISTMLALPPGLSPAWGNATSIYIPSILPFQRVTTSYYVNVDSQASSGNYPLSLLINSNNQVTKQSVNFIVQQKAKFQLVTVDDSQIYAGAVASPFKILIKNTGDSVAQSMTAKLLSANDLAGVRSNTITNVGDMVNIGNVLPGQTFTTFFLVNPDPNLTGDKSATIELDWTQTYTNPATGLGISSSSFVQTLTIPYHVASGSSYLLYYNAIPWTFVIIVLAFVIGIAIFIKARKSRIQKVELATAGGRGFFESVEPQQLTDLGHEVSGGVFPEGFDKSTENKDTS